MPRLVFPLPSHGEEWQSRKMAREALAQIKAQYHGLVAQLQLPCGIMSQTCNRPIFFPLQTNRHYLINSPMGWRTSFYL